MKNALSDVREKESQRKRAALIKLEQFLRHLMPRYDEFEFQTCEGDGFMSFHVMDRVEGYLALVCPDILCHLEGFGEIENRTFYDPDETFEGDLLCFMAKWINSHGIEFLKDTPAEVDYYA